MQYRDLDWLHDDELLRRVGRKPLTAILDLLAPFLGQEGLALPDSSLPDARYFAGLADLLRSQPVKLCAYLPPFLSAAPAAGPWRAKPRPNRVTRCVAREICGT
jgi:hypothetical protein